MHFIFILQVKDTYVHSIRAEWTSQQNKVACLSSRSWSLKFGLQTHAKHASGSHATAKKESGPLSTERRKSKRTLSNMQNLLQSAVIRQTVDRSVQTAPHTAPNAGHTPKMVKAATKSRQNRAANAQVDSQSYKLCLTSLTSACLKLFSVYARILTVQPVL